MPARIATFHGLMPESDKSAESRVFCETCKSIYRSGFEHCPIDQSVLSPVVGDPMLGEVLGGNYVIDKCVGEGAMGRVYLAHHKRLTKRRFAIKILLGELAADPTMRLRFGQEAEAASRLQHPNVVSVLDYGKTDAGLLYLVMEFVEGETLAERIEQGPIPQAEVVRLCKQICQGLTHAHDAGLVHRDFKPENVVLVDVGQGLTPQILDFGLAIISSSEESSIRLTTAGMVVGTPAYVSPEQARALPVDQRTDLFALGVAMYEMLAGQLPFDGGVIELLYANATKDAPAISERSPVSVSPAMESIVRKLMAREEENRFQSAAEVFTALEALQPVVSSARSIAATVTDQAKLQLEIAKTQVPMAGTGLTAAEVLDDEDEVVGDGSQQSRRRGTIAAAILLLGVGGGVLYSLRSGEESGSVDFPGRRATEPVATDVVNQESERTAPVGQPQEPVVLPPKTETVPSVAETEDAGLLAPSPETLPEPKLSKKEKNKREREKRRKLRKDKRDKNIRDAAAKAQIAAASIPKKEPEKTVVKAPVSDPEPVKTPPKAEPKVIPPPRKSPVIVPSRKPVVFDAATSIAELSIRGSLAKSEVRRAIHGKTGELRSCYQVASKRSAIAPKLTANVSFVIDEGGRAQGVKVAGSNLPGLKKCIIGTIKKVRTRNVPDIGTVKVSFGVAYKPK